MTLQKDLAIAKSDLRTAENMLAHAEKLAERGYVSGMQLEERRVAVAEAQLNVDMRLTQIEVLQEYTRKMELETLKGNLNAAKARLEANEERAEMDETRRRLAEEELGYCVIKAEKAGLVIHPSAARWRNAPEIAEGATVHKDQVLLLMPDLSQMQVKIGVLESDVDRIQPGLAARVELAGGVVDGEVISVASVTIPASWWTGNVAKYDTIVQLPSIDGLRPGMSAEVEVIVAEYEDVLTIPVAAIVEIDDQSFCWVRTAEGSQRRWLQLGKTNDRFTIVQAGLQQGDAVVLNPLALEAAPHKDTHELPTDP